MLAVLSAVAQLACGGGSSSKDAGHDGKIDVAVGDHAGAGDHPDATKPPDAAAVCADGGARVVSGEVCGCNSDCQSGFCVDGVCCDTSCDDNCKRCDVQGSMGTCSFVPAGLPPRAAAACPTTDAKTCGTDGMCDGQGSCQKFVMGTVCKAGTCDGAAVTGIQTCDGAGTCGGSDAKVCAPFSCDATKQDCFGACTSNSDCALGVQCMAGTCGLKMKGTSCGKDTECASGFCTDGVCCAVACQGPCVSCNQTGRFGTCWPIDLGNPDPRKLCKDSGAAKCGQTGACDGFGTCSKYQAETVCVLPSCAGTRLNTPGTCDGQGTCKPSGVMDCPPYACASGACNTTCATNADCAPGIACVNKSCGPRTNGGACTAGTDCASGFCTDGVCCNSACGGACQSCALASARGTCTPIAVGTVDNRKICKDTGVASCGTNGRCDGAGGCSKYATGSVCGSEKCVTNVYTGAPTCNSTGQCVAPSARACLPFACNGTKCFDACTTAANCVAPNVCNGNSCGKKPPGAPCSAGTECASTFCAQGFCCGTTCNAACKSCGLPGTEGVCTNVPTGAADPKATCLDQGAASCGTNGRCAAGACQKYAANTKCKDPTCPTGTTAFTGRSVCDGAGKCTTPTSTSCFPFACGVSACNATCKANADCAANATCINGSCGLEPKGGPCSASSQCASGLVCSAQNVCCNATCDGPCVSCTLPATPGTCSPTMANAPDPSGKCGVTAQATCGNDGMCDGKGACQKWPAPTQCVPPSCPANTATATLAKTCDGVGTCSVGGTTRACSPFMCNGSSDCNTTCTSNADCVPPNTCVGNTCGKKPAGAACATSDQCTGGLFCTDGFCCSSSACGACKACNGTGVCQNADGVACTAADKCHVTDGKCAAGACTSDPITCTGNNPCMAYSCDPATGCVHTPVMNGTACNDNNACTQTDTCQGGTCTGGNPVACPGATMCHGAQTCNSATGSCSGTVAPNGTACEDGNLCTMGDTCQGGACASGTTPTCTASDQCHVAGTCDPGTGHCSNPAKGNGMPCEDGNACTSVDTCQGGVCSPGATKACAATDVCHVVGACDPGTGQCPAQTNAADGTGCNDGNACTQTDTCQAGACTGGNSKTCMASDQCHVAGTCDTANGSCSNPSKENGMSCDLDGDKCTPDTCQLGICLPAPPTLCLDPLQSCDPGTGMCLPNI